MARRVQLPTRGNYDYYELPQHLQQLIEAMTQLEDARDALDSAERATRILDESGDPSDRQAWRWYQDASLAAYKLAANVRDHAELVYTAWRLACEEEEVAQRDTSQCDALAQEA